MDYDDDKKLDKAFAKIAERLQTINPAVDYKSSRKLTEDALLDLNERMKPRGVIEHLRLPKRLVVACLAEASINKMIQLGWFTVQPAPLAKRGN